MGNTSVRLILVGFIVLFAVLLACQNETDVSIAEPQIREVDIFTMDTHARRSRINAIYQESREMRSVDYISDSGGGHRVKALLLQLEFSILVYAEGKSE